MMVSWSAIIMPEWILQTSSDSDPIGEGRPDDSRRQSPWPL